METLLAPGLGVLVLGLMAVPQWLLPRVRRTAKRGRRQR